MAKSRQLAGAGKVDAFVQSLLIQDLSGSTGRQVGEKRGLRTQIYVQQVLHCEGFMFPVVEQQSALKRVMRMCAAMASKMKYVARFQGRQDIVLQP
jgi:hypothetical protein